MADLKTILKDRVRKELRPLVLPHSEHIHLIDPPDHPNVGDCAILLGELDFLAREFPRSRLEFHDHRTYCEASDKRIEQASVILIHGGGNFGDIWPHHHKIRLDVIRRFRDQPIVQLPQSIHFTSADALRQTQIAIAEHPQFTLMVRDTRSEAFAREHFACAVVLCPDMAFAMRPISRRTAQLDAFCLLRGDKEAVAPHIDIQNALRQMPIEVSVGDWLEDPNTINRLADRSLSKLTRKFPAAYPLIIPPALVARKRYAEERVEIGIRLLSRGKIVITDRLHAHIMSVLLGIPNIVFRSFDAKAEALYNTWTHKFEESRLANDAFDLPVHVSDLLKG